MEDIGFIDRRWVNLFFKYILDWYWIKSNTLKENHISSEDLISDLNTVKFDVNNNCLSFNYFRLEILIQKSFKKKLILKKIRFKITSKCFLINSLKLIN
jgi:hypothetical protein